MGEFRDATKDSRCICGHPKNRHIGGRGPGWRDCSGSEPGEMDVSGASTRCDCPRFRLGLGQASAPNESQ